MEEIIFNGYNPILQFLRTDKSVRVTFDVSMDQYNNIKDIPLLSEGMYKVTLTKLDEQETN